MILKKHAEHGCGAEYLDRGEQEWHLVAAFDKWAEKGMWLAAAQKVHQEQLKHVQKECFERLDQDIRSDGSHVEGTHKGWNSLQYAQPSRIGMLSALSHDFVLHRNIRVTSSRHQMMLFVKLTHSSHHIQLSNHIARLYNRLYKKDTQLLPPPELPGVDSGETFGLVVSDNTTMFGGLLIKEETADAKLTHNLESSTVLSQRYVIPSLINGTHKNFLPNSHRVIQQSPALTSTTQSPLTNIVYANFLLNSWRITHAGINNSITWSQHLFSIATGIDPRSLTFQSSDEFYLFMDMWAKFIWLSYQIFSCITLYFLISGYEHIAKRNNETFWHHHCSVVPLVKEELGKRSVHSSSHQVTC
ncbi:uncharacterized protein HD556DRAFT_1223238 [Suillus plorans]|uniref:Uncharacterized protein n=1 Tax=Suillus plorans TaxID=116603 RepID=A0A9P7J9J3_9AGAM|nr:uncharacterized protein HD556DRAFT_1223238 [Suillus plorans]KAG1809841.1 hypothetical protein HD556DRAFT_1223238 [Suillus plorans]